DEAAIFTIHGFCQRVLAEKAFESGMDFRNELLVDDTELMEEIAQDFWRLRLHDASPLLAAFLLRSKESPASLLTAIRDFVGRPYLRELLPPPGAPAERVEADLGAAFE